MAYPANQWGGSTGLSYEDVSDPQPTGPALPPPITPTPVTPIVDPNAAAIAAQDAALIAAGQGEAFGKRAGSSLGFGPITSWNDPRTLDYWDMSDEEKGAYLNLNQLLPTAPSTRPRASVSDPDSFLSGIGNAFSSVGSFFGDLLEDVVDIPGDLSDWAVGDRAGEIERRQAAYEEAGDVPVWFRDYSTGGAFENQEPFTSWDDPRLFGSPDRSGANIGEDFVPTDWPGGIWSTWTSEEQQAFLWAFPEMLTPESGHSGGSVPEVDPETGEPVASQGATGTIQIVGVNAAGEHYAENVSPSDYYTADTDAFGGADASGQISHAPGVDPRRLTLMGPILGTPDPLSGAITGAAYGNPQLDTGAAALSSINPYMFTWSDEYNRQLANPSYIEHLRKKGINTNPNIRGAETNLAEFTSATGLAYDDPRAGGRGGGTPMPGKTLYQGYVYDDELNPDWEPPVYTTNQGVGFNYGDAPWEEIQAGFQSRTLPGDDRVFGYSPLMPQLPNVASFSSPVGTQHANTVGDPQMATALSPDETPYGPQQFSASMAPAEQLPLTANMAPAVQLPVSGSWPSDAYNNPTTQTPQGGNQAADPNLSSQSRGLLGEYGLGSPALQGSGYWAEMYDPIYGQAAQMEALRQEPTNFQNMVPQIQDAEGNWINNPAQNLLTHYLGEAEQGDVDARLANMYGLRYGLETYDRNLEGGLLASDIAERNALRDYGGTYRQSRSQMGQQMGQAGASMGGSAYQNMLSGMAGQAATDRSDLANQYNVQRINIAQNAANQMVGLITGANISSGVSTGDAFNVGLTSGQSGVGSQAASEQDTTAQYALQALGIVAPFIATGLGAYNTVQNADTATTPTP